MQYVLYMKIIDDSDEITFVGEKFEEYLLLTFSNLPYNYLVNGKWLKLYVNNQMGIRQYSHNSNIPIHIACWEGLISLYILHSGVFKRDQCSDTIINIVSCYLNI